ncbi:TPA: PTS system mannose/fructose/sorbose family transporter subunit IID [Klebsiella oxytoca]|jgi:PTS system mannose-specific IID component|uniref:PTS system mannose/fructose/sorbose family transporter subunit IID n=1 Tax=Klebsiella oxytoca TaxID=571 RepID=UPI00109333D2|nr:PTS system mannose/fructose/sorbose family transporter subunit IID [Klebsiella oxytoca]EJG2191246.1 PTS system mannose/fructose/sorbose family transporter subunit IID [Klebsiella oxytoca]MBL0805392.1 PTS system mannose/fructose/sorbose family transporter subunit IID [Klebsiella oxytoca]MBZ6766161.1 PTS system mannose/fructose/sorbose family transporter subunit IID [Klebsiella oxytoca]MDM4273463.1 PTS system mannose/fructose/sorbose family transporter subunit IID [Klebsiella oxytoca]MDX68212
MSDIASYRVAETATQDKKLTKQDLNRIFWNIQSMSFSYNYEKLQTIGFAHCMIPVLERLYADADKATRIKAMKRHLEFYNSQVNTGALILGVTAALEEKTSEEEKEAVVSVKAGLMGPFAGLGDSLLKFTWLPICGSIGAAFALQGNIIGPLLMFILFNIVNVGSKYFFIHYGYNKGVDLIEQSKNSNIIQRISNIANVVGVMVLGSLIATTVKISTPLVIAVGEQSIKVQEMFDKVIPNLLTLLFALGIFFLVKKFKGKHTVALIIGMMCIGVIFSMLGILN